MPVTLTTTAKNELKKYAPNIRVEAHIIKNYYATPTEIEITERINQYGEMINDSTLIAKNWTLPHLTSIVVNENNYFNQYSDDSIWAASPAKDPEECLLRIRTYVITDEGEEMLIEYLGRITNVLLKSDNVETYAELETVFAPGVALQKHCTRRDGSYTDFDWSAGTFVRYNKGGQIIPAPYVNGTPSGGGHSYYTNIYSVAMYDISTLTEMICRVHTAAAPYPVGWEAQPNSYIDHDVLARIGAGESIMVSWRNIGGIMSIGPGTYSDMHFYNPIQFHDVSPCLCALDLLRYGAGLGSGVTSHIDETSFSDHDSYFTGQTPSFILRPVVYDKSFAEGFIDILGYMPEMFVWWSYDSKLTMSKHWSVLNSPSYKFTEALLNYTSMEVERYADRSCNDLEVTAYSAHVPNKGGVAGTEGWHAEREIEQFDISKSRYPKKIRRKPTDFSLPASSVDKLISVDRPWISEDSGSTADAHTVNLHWVENYLKVWSQPVKRVIITSDVRALEIECGDKIGVDVPALGMDDEVYVCASKSFNFDTLETAFVLAQMTF